MSAYKNLLEEAIELIELNAQVMSVPPSVLKRTREALSLLRSHAIEFEGIKNDRKGLAQTCANCPIK